MHYRIFSLLLLAVVLGLVAVPAQSQSTGNCEAAIGEAYLDINNVRARILNNGNLFWRGSPHVYNIPKGGPSNAIFTSGIWLGGTVAGQLRVAAARYNNYEFWAGPLGDDGSPPASCDSYDRVFKVSKEDVVSYDGTGAATPDLQDWPTGLGAPTLDANGDLIDLTGQPLASRIDRKINLGSGERPAILGDQMLWWIMNDRGNVHGSTDTPPIGLEAHVSAFAFNTAGAIGNTTFYKYRLFYKGTSPLEDAYMGIFSDPDLGNFDDDYVGSDTTLGLGYVYNADNDDEGGEGYGEAPPAAGYDFFQGPLVDDDGIDNNGNGEVDEAGERLKMTTFAFYNNGGGVIGDPTSGPDYYNYMRGRWKDGQRFTLGGNGRDFSNIPTNFHFPGAAENSEFWTELNSDGQGTSISPADRRFVMSTGPFTIRPNDEQEIVFGVVTSFGSDHLDSIRQMKADDLLAQAVFDINFELPSPPAAPRVTTTAKDGGVLLEWGYNPTDNNYLDSYRVIDPLLSDDVSDNDYEFEGYNVYQFASRADQEGKVLKVYDKINGIKRVVEGTSVTFVTAEGNDTGVKHFHDVGGLTNYTTYYFGVQAYAYNAESGQKVYLGPINRFSVVPGRTDLVLSDAAVELASSSAAFDFSSTLEEGNPRRVSKVGAGGGFVAAKVVNPEQVVDATYRVEFKSAEVAAKRNYRLEEASEVDPTRRQLAAQKGASVEEVTVYDVARDGTVIFDGTAAAAAVGGAPPQGSDLFTVDGMSMSISGPPKEFLGMDERAGPASDEVIDSGLWHSLNSGSQRTSGGTAWYGDVQGSGSSNWVSRLDWVGGLEAATPKEMEIRFVDNPEVNGQVVIDGWGDGSHACGFLMCGWVEGTDRLYEGDADPSQITPVEYGNLRLPFQVWVLDPVAGTEEQVNVAILDGDGDGWWEPCGRNDGAFAQFGDGSGCTYDRIYSTLVPYDEAALLAGQFDVAAVQDGQFWDYFPAQHGIGRLMLAPWFDNYRDGATGLPFAAPPSSGTVIRFRTSKPNLPGDVFSFSTVGLGANERDVNQQIAALDEIGISPNPYKGASSYEVSQLVDQVRFTNMPVQATIRVFSLSGTLLTTLEKNSPAKSFAWDLTTEEGLPMASGMYIIHVEVPNLGERIIKFGVIKKRVQLNTF